MKQLIQNANETLKASVFIGSTRWLNTQKETFVSLAQYCARGDIKQIANSHLPSTPAKLLVNTRDCPAGLLRIFLVRLRETLRDLPKPPDRAAGLNAGNAEATTVLKELIAQARTHDDHLKVVSKCDIFTLVTFWNTEIQKMGHAL